MILNDQCLGNVSNDYILPAIRPTSLFFLWFTLITGLVRLPCEFRPTCCEPLLSSNKSHIRKSEACSTRSSAMSAVRSIIEQTSSKLLSTSDTPHHSKILSPCCSPPFSAGPPKSNSIVNNNNFPTCTK